MARKGNGDLEARTLTRFRFDGQIPSNQADPFLDDPRTLARRFEVGLGFTSRERKASPVIVDRQHAAPVHDAEPDEDIPGTAVLPHVHQGLLYDSSDLAAGTGRQRHPIAMRDEPGPDARLPLESLDDVGQRSDDLTGIEIDWLHPLHQLAKAEDFPPKDQVQTIELAGDSRQLFGDLGAQCRQLDLNTQDDLDDPVVELARDTGALDGRGVQPHLI
jgi:hypothetical protein